MPSSSSNRSRRSRTNSNFRPRTIRRGIAPSDPFSSLLSWDHRPTGVTGTLIPPDDISRRPPNFVANQVPPRTLRNQIYWVQESRHILITGAGGSGDQEFNYSFQLVDLVNAGALTALFDQYFVHSVLAIWTFQNETSPYPQLYTAIDYDSTAAISSVSAIQQYQSVLMSVCMPSLSVQRLVRPTVQTQLFNSSSSSSPAGVSRYWVDCDYNTIEHYGLRSIFAALGSSVVSLELVYTVGFRNTR